MAKRVMSVKKYPIAAQMMAMKITIMMAAPPPLESLDPLRVVVPPNRTRLIINLVASVMGFFSPHICETAGGVSNEYSNWMNCIQWATVVVVTFGISHIIDRTSHKALYITGLVFALCTWLLIVTVGVNSLTTLWAFVILWGLNGGVSVQIFYALWGSELFPAKFRAGAQGLMFFVVRGLSAIWGLVFTYIYGENGEGFILAAYCMIVLLLISLIVGVIGCPNTRGKSLEEITRERYKEL